MCKAAMPKTYQKHAHGQSMTHAVAKIHKWVKLLGIGLECVRGCSGYKCS